MRILNLVLAVGFSLSALPVFAEESTVFCKSGEGKAVDLQAEDNYECRDALLGNWSGDSVCFTGKRATAIDLLNGVTDAGLFDGTDGEYIKDAHFKGRDEISYTRMDDANDASEKMSLGRCTTEFFR